MKKFLCIPFLVCLMVFPAMAQDNDVSPNLTNNEASIQGSGGSRVLGSTLFRYDVESIAGSARLLGVEFDGTNFYISGGTVGGVGHEIYVINQTGGLVTQYLQPGAAVGSWGFRDLAWDGTYLYGGQDSWNPGMFHQIDPATGTLIKSIGPVGSLNPTRALAYDETTDTFWTASWGSDLFHVDRNGIVIGNYPDINSSKYGMAKCDGNGLAYIWDQALGTFGYEIDLSVVPPLYTGRSFPADPNGAPLNNLAGGACCYVNDDMNDGVNPNVDGIWKFVGLHQSTPDVIFGYEIDMAQLPLVSLPKIISATGLAPAANANVQFDLYYGAANAGRTYLMLGGVTGAIPGTPLPGGGGVIPVNWDILTSLLVGLGWGIGTLDAEGEAQLVQLFPTTLGPLTIFFGYGLAPPLVWGPASNGVILNFVP
jgi:hypothetical protein